MIRRLFGSLAAGVMFRKRDAIVAMALALAACSGGAGNVVAGSSATRVSALENARPDTVRSAWHPATIEVNVEGGAKSTLVFPLNLQTYRLSQSCDPKVHVAFTFRGGSIQRGAEYDTYEFTPKGSARGNCVVTARFGGSKVRAELLVTVE